MATPDRPKAPPAKPVAAPPLPPQARRGAGVPAPPPVPQAPPPPALASAIVGSLKDVARSSVLEKRPYLKFAFANPYNLSLFGGMLAAAGLTLNPFLAILAVGLESLWLLYAPDSAAAAAPAVGSALRPGPPGASRPGTRPAPRAAGASRAQARRHAHGPPGGDPPARRAEPVVHRRAAPHRADEDRAAGGRVHRHGGHVGALRRVPAAPWTSTRSTRTARGSSARSKSGKAGDSAGRPREEEPRDHPEAPSRR